MPTRPRTRPTALLVMCLLSPCHAAAEPDSPIDDAMYRDPDLPVPRVVKTFHPRLKDLWLEALARPEADLKCRAAQTIAQAHELGMAGLEAAIDPLIRELDRPDPHPTVVMAVAKALVTLDARTAAPQL